MCPDPLLEPVAEAVHFFLGEAVFRISCVYMREISGHGRKPEASFRGPSGFGGILAKPVNKVPVEHIVGFVVVV